MKDAEKIAAEFHRVYELLAPTYGHKTREASAVPWELVPETNRRLMIGVVRLLLDTDRISVPSPVGRLSWLNGWHWKKGTTDVLIGTGLYCIGCGCVCGGATVVIDEAWTPPTQPPDWPFPESACPVCLLRDKEDN